MKEGKKMKNELNKNDINNLMDYLNELSNKRAKELENATDSFEQDYIKNDYKEILKLYQKLDNIYKNL